MKLEAALRLTNVPPWWQYTRGHGVKVAVLGTPAGNQYAIPVNYTGEWDWHEHASAYLIKQIAPEATVYGLAFYSQRGAKPGNRYNGNWNFQDCLCWCLENHVDILSMSFSTSYSNKKEELLHQLVAQGCIPFASAGNRGDRGTTWPGSSPNTVCVGGYSDVLEGKAHGSGEGPEVTLLAPTGILVPLPNGDITIYPDTSGATPVAAGMAVLWKAMTGGIFKDFLEFAKANSGDMYEPGHDEISGYGLFVLPDPSTLLRKEEPGMHKVCLDPGHGGTDPGAIGPGGLKEKDVNLAVTLRTAEHLQRHGVQLVMTRDTDQTVSLDQRCKISDNASADLFVSIHCNAAEDRTAHGTETWYVSPTGQKLAQKVEAELVAALKRVDRGIKQGNLYVLKSTKAPAVLTELAFISNPAEEKLLASTDFQGCAARAIAKGILGYLGVVWKEPEPPKPDPAPAKLVLKLTVGGRQITRSDGKVFPMDVPARVEAGRTLVPLRAIAEALGCFVHYDPVAKEITITM